MEFPYNKCQRELQELLKSQYPLIFLRSAEESRAVSCVIDAHQGVVSSLGITDSELARWSIIDGFKLGCPVANNPGQIQWETMQSYINYHKNHDLSREGITETIVHSLNFLTKVLQEQASQKTNIQHTYILPDWSSFVESNHKISRQLKELVIAIEQKRPRPRMSLIIIGADWLMPKILHNSIYILDLPLPIGVELYQSIFSFAEKNYNVSHQDAVLLAEQAQGMPLQAAAQTAKLITAKNLWQQPHEAGQLLLEIKKQEIRKTGVLEYVVAQGQGLQAVGGLDVVKSWVKTRQKWFEQDTNPEMRPRAILLEGFPGCGKTFLARAISQEWRIPQINFELSKLPSKLICESESYTFQVLRAIEAAGPNILFIDELEKAFAGFGGDDYGLSRRQFGTLLSWLYDHEYPIFFIATANDRTNLPPEIFRAGRFDEIFIFMPPNRQERQEIIQKRSQFYKLPPIPPQTLDLLVENTCGFSGAELDKLIKETIYLTDGYLPTEVYWREALAQIVPQYRTPKMQALLQKYLHLLETGWGKPASSIETGFWESLILPASQ